MWNIPTESTQKAGLQHWKLLPPDSQDSGDAVNSQKDSVEEIINIINFFK